MLAVRLIYITEAFSDELTNRIAATYIVFVLYFMYAQKVHVFCQYIYETKVQQEYRFLIFGKRLTFS